MYVESNEPPLKLQSFKLAMNYLLKMKSLPDNPTMSVSLETQPLGSLRQKKK